MRYLSIFVSLICASYTLRSYRGSRPALGPTKRPVRWVSATFPEGNPAGA